MFLVIRLNGVELARQAISRTDKISEVIDNLKKQFKNEIQKSNEEPEFYLESIASSINSFTSLLSKRGN